MEVGAIVISPTRELATQISEILRNFLEQIPSLKQILLVGGVTLKEDAEKLKKGVNIIIATPGRLEDILSNYNFINLNLNVKSLVINFSQFLSLSLPLSPSFLSLFLSAIKFSKLLTTID